ncbi:MAG: hypothetical protein ACYCX4_01490 [Bacillota bacterium]
MNEQTKEQLRATYYNAVQTQLILQPLLTELDEIPLVETEQESPLSGRAWLDDDILWFSIPQVPPIMKGAGNRIRRDIRNHWMQIIVRAYTNLGLHVNFEKAIAVISIYTTGGWLWDTDNRSVHAIINGLRHAGVIENDDWHNLAYMVRGQGNQQSCQTQVAVLNMDDLPALAKLFAAGPREPLKAVYNTPQIPQKTDNQTKVPETIDFWGITLKTQSNNNGG